MMRRKNSWQQARLTSLDYSLILYGLFTVPLVQGLDYITGDDSNSKTLSVVERFLSLNVWGAIFIVGSLTLAYGVIMKWHRVVYIGHAILAPAYTVLMVGIFISCLPHSWLDGSRSAAVLYFPTILHWVFLLRTGPEPLKSHDVAPVEMIEGPQ